MNTELVTVKCLVREGAKLPEYKTAGAAGADICAYVDHSLILKKGTYAAVPTGLSFEIPEGYEIQIRPRSGLASSHGITCLNTPGTIDSDYRGEVRVILVNHGDRDYEISNGERIAQIVVAPVLRPAFTAAEALSATDRGAHGFGSTGKA